MPKNSEYLGYVSERKREIFAKSKVFVFPSLYEGFSLVTAEALASYLPAVIWDLPWTRRFSKGVIKVPFDNVDIYANEIVRLIKDEEYREKLGREGRDFISNLSLDSVSKKELEDIIKILQS